ncbi:Sua5/YciO/YrdC/YwlC family protein [bacterium]|nr:Sua5/YciO/YrdC/YwlC family protein [bacterium]MDB4561970.1 Sua5/YciO/YrdC/YwlC family protein [bacterium]
MSTSESDLCRLLDALDGDGVIVAPCPVGYLAATSSAAGVDRIFELKGRDRSRSLSVGGHALHEGRRYLQELAGIGGAELLELSATMGLIGTRRHDAPPTPEGVGTSETLAVFLGLGPLLDELVVRQRAAGRTLFVTSANASGTGNAVLASQLPPALRGGAVTALIDDSCIPSAQRRRHPAPASPMVRLGERSTLVREGAQQDLVTYQLARAGFAAL